MRSLTVLALGAVVAALALPAEAASPPKREIARLKREVAALKAKADRLERDSKALRDALGRWDRAWVAMARHIASVDPCPITQPNNSPPPGSTFGAEFHGNGQLWVGLWRSNVVVQDRAPDGSIDAKFGWWREARGQLRIDGHRLDGSAPSAHGEVPSGYGDAGFQATGIIFPTEGCWEVTGRVGDASLTFVTLVLAAT